MQLQLLSEVSHAESDPFCIEKNYYFECRRQMRVIFYKKVYSRAA